MAGFDPDAYLAQSPANGSAFDPDAYLRGGPPPGLTLDDFQKIKATGQTVPPQLPIKIGAEGFPDAMRETVKNAGWVERNMAGFGTAPTNLYQGAKQVLGNGDDQAIQANRIMAHEAPLGALAGNMALLAPTMLVPGANTVAGAGVVGAVQGLLQPTQGDESRMANTALGGVGGMVGQAVGNKIGGYFTGRLENQEAEAAANASRNSVRDATLKAGQDAGYITPPSAVNPSWVNNRIEGIAGKAAIGQEVSVRNQQLTDALARKAAGLPADAPLSETVLKDARYAVAQPYRDVAALPPDNPLFQPPFKSPQETLDALSNTRLDAKLSWGEFNRQGSKAAYKDAIASDAKAATLENSLDAAATATENPQLLDALRASRQQIAKIHDVENAVNVGNGGIDASVIGRALDRGAPLSGELETIGRFQQAFPSYMREGSKVPTPGVSKSEALSVALLGGIGTAAGGPMGAMAGLLPLLSGPARSLVLSKPYQALFAQPKYGVGLTTKALGQITPDRAALLGRALAPTLATQ